ncbi:MAG: type I restriction enzyme HsdR N-terminal domain-containing protein [Desulfobacterales bacterium]|nr:type I restriction enzyme HsdR N-terminal domain-containing protein [Desulfobacterales bacterium]
MCAQQVILGEIQDFITSETLVDTLDERARQKIARFIVEKKGYFKDEIDVRRQITLVVAGKTGTVKVDFVIRVADKAFMIIIFGPGSLVSRERPAVSAARLVKDYEVPFAVVTNGEGAEVLETRSGKVVGEGLQSIPSREDALKKLEKITFEMLSQERLERERRILYAFEVLAARECELSTRNL